MDVWLQRRTQTSAKMIKTVGINTFTPVPDVQCIKYKMGG